MVADALVLGFPSHCFFFFWLSRIFIAARGLSLGVASRGCSVIAVCWLLITMVSLVAEHTVWGIQASVVEALRF